MATPLDEDSLRSSVDDDRESYSSRFKLRYSSGGEGLPCRVANAFENF